MISVLYMSFLSMFSYMFHVEQKIRQCLQVRNAG